ncbi:MAG: hypothetical protein HZB54_08540 [Deltaproteobacteria bacterium]|nr:hypothetical protein [Deltaproteobacteria bacterium]
MNGKINIVFGFIYFAFTAVLGPTVLVPHFSVTQQAMEKTAQSVGNVKQEAQPTSASTAEALSSILDYLKVAKPMAKGAHSHGNLEALLNIAAGVVLLSLAIPASFKALLSIIFLVGAVFHSGMLYLGSVFHLYWAFNLTVIGAIAIIAGLVGTGIASFIGIKKAEA